MLLQKWNILLITIHVLKIDPMLESQCTNKTYEIQSHEIAFDELLVCYKNTIYKPYNIELHETETFSDNSLE